MSFVVATGFMQNEREREFAKRDNTTINCWRPVQDYSSARQLAWGGGGRGAMG